MASPLKVAVFGATGYLGKAIASCFVAKGARVYAPARRLEVPARLLDLEVAEVTPILFDSVSDLASSDVLRGCNVIVDAVGTRDVAVDFFNTVKPFVDAGARFILTSGLLLYGHHPNTVIDESVDAAAHCAEMFRWRVAHENNVLAAGGIVLRPGWVYGHSQGKYSWFGSISAPHINMVGSATKRTSWIHVDDAAAAFYATATADAARVRANIFNVAADHYPHHQQVYDAMAAASGTTVRSVPVPEGNAFAQACEGEIMCSSAKLHRATGWSPVCAPFLSDVALHYRGWLAQRAQGHGSAASH
eukprot:gnl/Spiro4/14008_TR7510_c0_g1_i1.p1 gnl/Spiro4/14008_TR7510_c0_g1~~gnl/Spiro4/14008_TR7510_c0_g1_i1.p1  ORF type:complete len:313 (-),score=132.27 gnl/Spiro4/14008_TR7510_c0_g1_i1:69-977(-)